MNHANLFAYKLSNLLIRLTSLFVRVCPFVFVACVSCGMSEYVYVVSVCCVPCYVSAFVVRCVWRVVSVCLYAYFVSWVS